MDKEVRLLKAMDEVFEKVRRQSPEEYVESVKAHSGGPIARFLTDVENSPAELLGGKRSLDCFFDFLFLKNDYADPMYLAEFSTDNEAISTAMFDDWKGEGGQGSSGLSAYPVAA